ncbi:MAG: SEC-C domain-containing protein [Xanthomonadales bacterium]|nr:SEC-C domain-containing protein [Xanthomonadales bacterium]
MVTPRKSRRPKFKLGRFDPCFCNSGKRFKSCCGSKDPHREPPYGVQVINNFLSDQQCDDWVTRAELKKRTWLDVVDSEKSSSDKVVRKMDPARVTQKVELEEMQEELNAAVTRSLHEKVEPYYKHKSPGMKNPPYCAIHRAECIKPMQILISSM